MSVRWLCARRNLTCWLDWRATLYDINVLRNQTQQRAENYASILRLASADAVRAKSPAPLVKLARHLFDDPDVGYVLFTDAAGTKIYDRVSRPFESALRERGRRLGFRRHYKDQIERDVRDVLADPEMLRQRVMSSRHADFIQIYTDAETHLIARVTRLLTRADADGGAADSGRTASSRTGVVFQDRVRDPIGRRDREVAWALARITDDGTHASGAILLAFRMERVNAQTRTDLLRGSAMTAFFVIVILIQSFTARLRKLRLLDLEAARASARDAIRRAMAAGTDPQLPCFEIAITFEQAERIGGTVYDIRRNGDAIDVLLAVPSGAGVDVSFFSVVIADEYRRLRRDSAAALPELFDDLVARCADAPFTRPMATMLLRIDPKEGRVSGISAGLLPPYVLIPGSADPATQVRRIARHEFTMPLPPGASVLVYDDGLDDEAPRHLSHAQAAEIAARNLTIPAKALAEKIADEATKREHGHLADDVFVLVIKPAA